MRVSRSKWFIGSLLAAAGLAAALGACSSNGDGELPLASPRTEAPRSSTPETRTGSGILPTDGGSGDTTALTPNDSGSRGSRGDGGVDCEKFRAELRDSKRPGVFCPFLPRTATPDGGKPKTHCGENEHCCLYEKSSGKDSTCNARSEACAAGPNEKVTDFECARAADCPAGNVCCFDGNVELVPGCPGKADVPPRSVRGSKCRTSCEPQEKATCAKVDSSDCPSGTTCTPGRARSIDMGFCLETR